MREFILTFFYSGKAKKAPGTCGSLASIIFWLIIFYFFTSQNIDILWQNIFWTIFLIVGFFYGMIASPKYAKQFGEIDHQSIVLDEVVGQILTLQTTILLLGDINYFSEPKTLLTHITLCFVLFRYFDIKKPLFIGYCDRTFKNGFGVMFDDLVSGILAAAVVAVLIVVF
jgi:phosphatidylglycerophosphatase A